MSDFDRQDPPDPMKNIVGGLVSGQMSRDEFIKRARMLGLSATAIGGMLVAAGKATAADHACRSATRGRARSTCWFRPRAPTRASRTRFGDIKKQFGIDVKMTALPVGPLNEKPPRASRRKTGTYDAISVLGFTVSQFVGGGYFMPLNAHRQEAAARATASRRTSRRASSKYLGYYDIRRQAFGGTTLYLIPGLYAGPIIMFYRKDLLDEGRNLGRQRTGRSTSQRRRS